MGGLPYGDIIVIGAIAIFILLRYRSMLGEKTDRDNVTPIRPLQEFERVIQLPEREPVKASVILQPSADHGEFTATYQKMQTFDRQFTPEEFLEGARGAFEVVLEAFNEGDRETLKVLLSKDIYKEFDASLSALSTEGKTQHTTLLAIVEAVITEAELTGTRARITVKFVSEQVHLVRNLAGDIVEGDASHQEAVEDSWTFERTLSSGDPAWKVIET